MYTIDILPWGAISMLNITGPTYRTCDGLTRRSFLKAGFLALGGLTLADHLRLKARALTPNPSPGGRGDAGGEATRDTAVILFWMGGGPSHIDMYDLKPNAPAEFRGEFREIDTNVNGIRIGEHLPLQARLMDKMSVVRSVTHTNPGHGMGSHWMLTGYVPTIEINDNLNPCAGSVVARMRGASQPRMPAYVCVPSVPGHSTAAYLGAAYNPFAQGADPSSDNFSVRDLRLAPNIDLARFRNRRELLQGVDRLRRDVDREGSLEGYDRFYRDAFEIVTSPQCREAFDMRREDPRTRDRYGRDSWGQSAPLGTPARRGGRDVCHRQRRRLGYAQ